MELIDAVVGGLVGGLVTLLLTFRGYRVEERRRREDALIARVNLQNQYIVESSADLGSRASTALGKAKALAAAHADFSWESIYEPLDNLSKELVSQSPRYRLAGVGAASEEISTLLWHFLEQVSRYQGAVESDRQLAAQLSAQPEKALMEENVGPDASLPWYAEGEVDRLVEEYRQSLFAALDNAVGRVLHSVAHYDPGPPLQISSSPDPFRSAHQVMEDWATRKRQHLV
jgi:hypothetical protein